MNRLIQTLRYRVKKYIYRVRYRFYQVSILRFHVSIYLYTDILDMFAKYKFIERKSRFLLPPIYTCYKHNEETAKPRRACNTGYLSVCCLVSIGQPIPKVLLQVFVYLSYIIYFLMLFLFLSQITQYLTIITEIFRTLVCSRCVLLFFWQKN